MELLDDVALNDYFDQFNQYRRLLYYIANNIVKDEWEANDIIQETFVRSYLKRHTLRNKDHYKAWLSVICKNLSINYYNKSKLLVLDSGVEYLLDSQQNSNQDIVVDTVVHNDNCYQLRIGISQLPDIEKNCLVDFYFENLRYVDIAEKYNVKLNTVKTIIRRAKKRLYNYFMSLENNKNQGV